MGEMGFSAGTDQLLDDLIEIKEQVRVLIAQLEDANRTIDELKMNGQK